MPRSFEATKPKLFTHTEPIVRSWLFYGGGNRGAEAPEPGSTDLKRIWTWDPPGPMRFPCSWRSLLPTQHHPTMATTAFPGNNSFVRNSPCPLRISWVPEPDLCVVHPPPKCREQTGSINIRGIKMNVFKRHLGSTYHKPTRDNGDA